MKTILMTALIFLSCVVAFHQEAMAFCIYNHADTSIHVTQKSGHSIFKGFNADIVPGDKGCCQWEDKDCNKHGHKDSPVSFNISHLETHLEPVNVPVCKNFEIKAGGWITVTGSKDEYSCNAHYSLTTPMFSDFPDTGQKSCYNNTEKITCPSPGEAFYGQDSQFSRLPRSYTKLGQSGEELPDQASPAQDGGRWLMTRDNVTGLTWEVKTLDNQNELYPYSHFLETNIYDYVRRLNNENYGGYSDWRIPDIKELSSLVNSSLSDPVIEDKWFPNTGSLKYWSINYYMKKHDDRYNEYPYAWILNMGTGEAAPQKKSVNSAVMAVRGSTADNKSALVDNNDGTVTDPSTGLMWMKCSLGQTWDDDNSVCQGYSARHTWQDTLNMIENLEWAGYSDWRLPNRNDMQSIVDYSSFNPAIDTLLKESTTSSYYWTSTTVAGKPDNSWHLNLYNGSLDVRTKPHIIWDARAVRGGHSMMDIETHNDSNKLFTRLEKLFPEILSPAPQNTIKNKELLYRCYPDTNVCTGTFENDLYYLDEQGTLHNLGNADYWLNTLESFIGWVIGTRKDTAAILYTDDGGKTWTEQGDPALWQGMAGNDVSAVDAMTAWAAVGDGSGDEDSRGKILYTSDGGKNWSVQKDVDNQVKQVRALSDLIAWAVTINGHVYRTTDGGKNWERISTGDITIDQVNRMDAVGNSIWIADEGETGNYPDRPGQVVYSNDFGESWQAKKLKIAEDNFGRGHNVSAYNEQIVWFAVWSEGILFRSDDGGDNIGIVSDSLGHNDLDDMCAPDENTLWLAQYQNYNAGTVYRAVYNPDAGKADVKEMDPLDQDGNRYPFAYGGVFCHSSDIIWVTGYNSAEQQGIILHTRDGGENWTRQELPESAQDVELWKISFARAN